MAKKDFNFTCTGSYSSFEKHESCCQLVLFIYSLSALLILFRFVAGLVFFFLIFCPHSKEGASPVWLTSSPWSNRNQTTAWAPQQALLKGASDRALKKGVFSQLPSTIIPNQQHDLDSAALCQMAPDSSLHCGSVLCGYGKISFWNSCLVFGIQAWPSYLDISSCRFQLNPQAAAGFNRWGQIFPGI